MSHAGMGDERRASVTQWLQRWAGGDAGAFDALLPLVYDELRAIARRALAAERAERTLQPTALVHEAWLKLVGAPPDDLDSRAHFFAVAARAMRQVLVDRARRRDAAKRDGGQRVSLSSLEPPDPQQALDLLALDQALDALAALDPRKARIVELRAFAGLEFAEIGTLLGLSRATLDREFRASRAWLYRALGGAPPEARA
jgi:RNA polymerase sigma factor (TIGR02999 family)